MNLFGKIFRRGKGICEEEFTREGCYRKQGDADTPGRLWYLIYVFRDPRLSMSQRERLIEDLFGEDSQHCPLGDNETHRNSKVNLHALILKSGSIVSKGSKYLTPDMIDRIFTGINLSHPDGFISLIGQKTSKTKTRPDSYGKTLRILFNSDKVSRETYWSNFDSIVSAYELLLEGYYRNAMSKDKEKSDELTQLFLDILLNPLVTELDIDKLCYSKYDWLRQVAIKHPLCQPASKVAVALLDASSNLD